MRAFRLFTAGLLVFAAGFIPYLTMAQGRSDGCPYLPAFQELRTRLPGMSAVDAAALLARYAASHENPEGCEYMEIDRLLSEQEVKLFQFSVGSNQMDAQAVFRCNQFEPGTARCEGPMEDGTAHPFSAGITPFAVTDSGPALVYSGLPGATLTGFYWLSLADALDGKPAIRIPKETYEIQFPHDAQDIVFIAVYETHDLWRYRKVVWYFGAETGDKGPSSITFSGNVKRQEPRSR